MEVIGRSFAKKYSTRLVLGLGLIVLLFTLYNYIFHVGIGEILLDTNKFKAYVGSLGLWGPFAIIFFMALAIIMSPLPSAPIAVASGTLFGHTWGTVYIVIGAIIAFTVSKLAGYELIKKFFGEKLETGFFKSQKNLALVLLVSRLIPFVSFDIVSYAAGLTPISFFSFATATFLGILPISFLLAHFGSDLGSSDPQKVMTTIFLLGFVTLIPFLVTKWIRRKRAR